MIRQCGDLLEKQFPLPVWRGWGHPTVLWGILGWSVSSYLAAEGEKVLHSLKMDFFSNKSNITVNEQTMWGFIREKISTSCVVGRGHPTVL